MFDVLQSRNKTTAKNKKHGKNKQIKTATWVTDGSQQMSPAANKNQGPGERKRITGVIKGVSVNVTTNTDTRFLMTKKRTKCEKRRK